MTDTARDSANMAIDAARERSFEKGMFCQEDGGDKPSQVRGRVGLAKGFSKPDQSASETKNVRPKL